MNNNQLNEGWASYGINPHQLMSPQVQQITPQQIRQLTPQQIQPLRMNAYRQVSPGGQPASTAQQTPQYPYLQPNPVYGTGSVHHHSQMMQQSAQQGVQGMQLSAQQRQNVQQSAQHRQQNASQLQQQFTPTFPASWTNLVPPNTVAPPSQPMQRQERISINSYMNSSSIPNSGTNPVTMSNLQLARGQQGASLQTPRGQLATNQGPPGPVQPTQQIMQANIQPGQQMQQPQDSWQLGAMQQLQSLYGPAGTSNVSQPGGGQVARPMAPHRQLGSGLSGSRMPNPQQVHQTRVQGRTLGAMNMLSNQTAASKHRSQLYGNQSSVKVNTSQCQPGPSASRIEPFRTGISTPRTGQSTSAPTNQGKVQIKVHRDAANLQKALVQCISDLKNPAGCGFDPVALNQKLKKIIELIETQKHQGNKIEVTPQKGAVVAKMVIKIKDINKGYTPDNVSLYFSCTSCNPGRLFSNMDDVGAHVGVFHGSTQLELHPDIDMEEEQAFEVPAEDTPQDEETGNVAQMRENTINDFYMVPQSNQPRSNPNAKNKKKAEDAMRKIKEYIHKENVGREAAITILRKLNIDPARLFPNITPTCIRPTSPRPNVFVIAPEDPSVNSCIPSSSSTHSTYTSGQQGDVLTTSLSQPSTIKGMVSPCNRAVQRVKAESGAINLDPDEGEEDDLVFVGMTAGKRSPHPHSSTSPQVRPASKSPAAPCASSTNASAAKPTPSGAWLQDSSVKQSSVSENRTGSNTQRTNIFDQIVPGLPYSSQPRRTFSPTPPRFGMSVPVSVPPTPPARVSSTPLSTLSNDNVLQNVFPNSISKEIRGMRRSSEPGLSRPPAFLNARDALADIGYLPEMNAAMESHGLSLPNARPATGDQTGQQTTGPSSPSQGSVQGGSGHVTLPSQPAVPVPGETPDDSVMAETESSNNQTGTPGTESNVAEGPALVPSSTGSAAANDTNNPGVSAQSMEATEEHISNQNFTKIDIQPNNSESEDEIIPVARKRRPPLISDSDSDREIKQKRRKVTRLKLPKDWLENPRKRLTVVLKRLDLGGRTTVDLKKTTHLNEKGLSPLHDLNGSQTRKQIEKHGRHRLLQLAAEINEMSDCEEERLNEFLDVCKATDKDLLARLPDCAMEIKTINVLCRGNVQQGRDAIEKWTAVKRFVKQILGHASALAAAPKKQHGKKKKTSLKFKMKKMPNTESEDSDYIPEWEMEATSSSANEDTGSSDDSSTQASYGGSQSSASEGGNGTKKRKVNLERFSTPSILVKSLATQDLDENDEEDSIDNYVEVVHKDFVCTFCGKKYKMEERIYSHIKTTHLQCSQCKRTFKSLRLLEAHLKRKGHQQKKKFNLVPGTQGELVQLSLDMDNPSVLDSQNVLSGPSVSGVDHTHDGPSTGSSQSADRNVQVIAENVDVATLQKIADAVLKLHGQPPGALDTIKASDLIEKSQKVLSDVKHAQTLSLIESYAQDYQLSKRNKAIHRRPGACLVQMVVARKVVKYLLSVILQWKCYDCESSVGEMFDSLAEAASHVAQEHSSGTLQLHSQIVYIPDENDLTQQANTSNVNAIQTSSGTTNNESLHAGSDVPLKENEETDASNELQSESDDTRNDKTKSDFLVEASPEDFHLMMDVEEAGGPALDSEEECVENNELTADTPENPSSTISTETTAAPVDPVLSSSTELKMSPGVPVAQVIDQNKETIVVSSQVATDTEKYKESNDSNQPHRQPSSMHIDESLSALSSPTAQEPAPTMVPKTSPLQEMSQSTSLPPGPNNQVAEDVDVILLSDTEEDSDDGESYIANEDGKKICMICMREMDSRKDLRNHIKNDHLTCRTCKKTTNSINGMNQHMKTHPEKIFEPELTIMKKRNAPESRSQCINIRADHTNSAMQELIKDKLQKIKDKKTDHYRVRQVVVNAESGAACSKEAFAKTMWSLILRSRSEQTNIPKLDDPNILPCQTVVYRTIDKSAQEEVTTEHDKFEVKWKCRKCSHDLILLSDLMDMALHAAEFHNCHTLLICGHIEYNGPPLEITVSDDDSEEGSEKRIQTEKGDEVKTAMATHTAVGSSVMGATSSSKDKEEVVSSDLDTTLDCINPVIEQVSPDAEPMASEDSPAKEAVSPILHENTSEQPEEVPSCFAPGHENSPTLVTVANNVVDDGDDKTNPTTSETSSTQAPLNAVIGGDNMLYIVIDGKLTPVNVVGTAGESGVTINMSDKQNPGTKLSMPLPSIQPQITNKKCEATEDPFMCRHCNGRFTDICMLHWHLKYVHFSAEIFTDQKYCMLCSDDMLSNSALVRHINGFHNLTAYNVNKQFQKKGPKMLYPPKRHVSYWFNDERAKGDKAKCRHCGILVKDLSWHMKSEHKALCFSCTMCKKGQKIFSSVNDLGRHLTKDHSGECQMCHTNKQVIDSSGCILDMESRKNMVQHLRTHYFEKPYLCDFCAFNTHSMIGFTDHVNKHSGAKPHVCPKCKAGFHLRSELKKHDLKKQCFSKQHTCKHCEKSFKSADSLTEHSWTHSMEKIFKCGYKNCDQAFRTSKGLVKHMKKHPLPQVTTEMDKDIEPETINKASKPPVIVSITKTCPKDTLYSQGSKEDDETNGALCNDQMDAETREMVLKEESNLGVTQQNWKNVMDDESQELLPIVESTLNPNQTRASEQKTDLNFPSEQYESDSNIGEVVTVADGSCNSSLTELAAADENNHDDELVVDERDPQMLDDSEEKQQIDGIEESQQVVEMEKDAQFDADDEDQLQAVVEEEIEEDGHNEQYHEVHDNDSLPDVTEEAAQDDINAEDGEADEGELFYNDENKIVQDESPKNIEYSETQEFVPMEESPELEEFESTSDSKERAVTKTLERSSLCPLRENIVCEEDEKSTTVLNKQLESMNYYQRLLEIDGVSTTFLRPKSKAQEVRSTLRRGIRQQDRYIPIRCGAKNVATEDVLLSITHFGDLIEEARELCSNKDVLICTIPPCIGKDYKDKASRVNSYLQYICDKYPNLHLVDTELSQDDMENNGVHIKYHGNLKVIKNIVTTITDLDVAKHGKVIKSDSSRRRKAKQLCSSDTAKRSCMETPDRTCSTSHPKQGDQRGSSKNKLRLRSRQKGLYSSPSKSNPSTSTLKDFKRKSSAHSARKDKEASATTGSSSRQTSRRRSTDSRSHYKSSRHCRPKERAAKHRK